MAKANLMFNQEEHFNGASFVHIFPRKDLGGLLDGTINFNHDYILNTIAQGISDMKESMNDLNILFEEIGEYDELHVADGERCRSYTELIDR